MKCIISLKNYFSFMNFYFSLPCKELNVSTQVNSYFSFSQYAISVRLASRVPIEECRRARTYKNDPHQWKYLCIEGKKFVPFLIECII